MWRMSQLLLKEGAQEIYLPVQGVESQKSLEQVRRVLKKVKPKELEINTVHMMASCPMGSEPKKSVVDLDGCLWNMKNVLITDASILPSNIGQSPQGTIMAFVHEVMKRHLEKIRFA